MATIALGVVGGVLASSGAVGATLGAVLTVVGTAIGSYIDNQFLFPALFPPEDVVGPRLNEIRIQHQDEGAPQNYALGSKVRGAGTVIWVSDLIEIERTTRSGGKGGGGSRKVVGYDYYVSLALLFAKVDSNAISTTGLKIIADGKTFYNDSAVINVASSLLQMAVQTVAGGVLAEIQSPSGGPDLSVFIPGVNVDVSGWSNGANNGTFQVVSSSRNPATGTSRVRIQNSAAVIEGAGASVVIDQNVDKFNPAEAKDVRVYSGSSGQSPDTLIESFQGTGEVPAWRGFAYGVIEELFLQPWGNRIPVLNVVWNPATTATVGGMISAICGRASEPGLADVSALGAQGPVDGFLVQGPQALSKMLQPLMIALDVVEQEIGASLRFFFRQNATVIDLDADYLAAIPEGSDAPRNPAEIADLPDLPIPREVNVRYFDVETDLQWGSQRDRPVGATSDNIFSIELPVNLNGGGAQARSIARRIAWTSRQDRRSVRMSLPMRFAHILENDIVRVVMFGRVWELLVHRVDRGENFIIDIEATEEDRSVLQQPGVAESPILVTEQLHFPAPVHRDEEPGYGTGPSPGPSPGPGPVPVPTPGLTTWHVQQDPEAFFGSVTLYRAPADDDDLMTEVGIIQTESTVGFTLTALGGGVIPGIVDEVNTLDVELYNDLVLETITEGEFYNGINRMIIGDEIIGFRDVTNIGQRRYRLSHLFRGLWATEGAIDVHTSAERAILLDAQGSNAGAFPLPHSVLGQTIYLKSVPAGLTLGDVDARAFDTEKGGLDPHPPIVTGVTRDHSTGDILIEWKRRTKLVTRLFGAAAVPLEWISEEYEIDIIDPDTGLVAETITVTGTESVEYTKAEQDAAGITAGLAFTVKVYQVNETLSPGLGGRSGDAAVAQGIAEAYTPPS